MTEIKSQKEKEEQLLKVSFVMSLAFAVVEFVVAIYTRSQSVLMDAGYDMTEVGIIGLTIFLTPLFYKPVSEKRPFGYSQFESVFVVVKNFILVAVTLGLLSETINVMLSGGRQVDNKFVFWFQLVLGVVSILTLIRLRQINKTFSSPVVDIEIYSWKIDTFYSFGMSGAFFIADLLGETRFAPILPYFDQIVAIIIVAFMIPDAIRMLVKSIRNMLLFAPSPDTVENIKTISTQILENYNYSFKLCDIYRTGRNLWVDIYFETSVNELSLKDYKKASDELSTAIKAEYEDSTCQLIIYED